MALNVMQYEDLVVLLDEVPGLVDRLQQRDSRFASGVLSWLQHVEGALERNRIPIVSQVATARAALIGAGRGVRPAEVTLTGRATTRKLADATATIVLQRGADLLHETIAERRAVFGEAERIARQAVTVADAKQLLPGAAAHGSHQAMLVAFSARIESDPDLASAFLHLVSLVGRTDVLVFLDRAISAHAREAVVTL